MREERFIDSAIRKALGRQTSGAGSSCPDENLLAAYLERSLSDPERSRLESHVADCASCREVLALAMKIAGDEPAAVGEIQISRDRKLFFRFRAPLAAVAALVLGIGVAVVFLLTYEVRKAERTEVAEQRLPAAAPAAAGMPEPPRDSPIAPAEPAKPAAPGPAPAQITGAQITADQVTRAKDKEIRAREQASSPEYLDSRGLEPMPPKSESDVLNEAAGKPAERKGDIQVSAAATPASGETGAGRVAGGSVGGVVGGILAPARPAEESAAREAEPQAAAITRDSGGAKSEALDQVAKLAVKSQHAALSAVSTPDAEPRLRDVLRRAAADEKAGKRRDSATRVIGGRTFELCAGYWVDLKCLDDPDAELIDCNPGSPELDEIRRAVPGLEELRRRGSPILISWKSRICVVR